MFFGIYMITVADPQILWNDGFYPLVDATILDGSFLKAEASGCAERPEPGIGRVFDLFGGLLGQTNPALLNAAGFSSSPHFMYSGNYSGGDRKGEWFQLYSIGSGVFRVGRWVTDPTGIRCGRASSTSRASSWNRITRCGSRRWETVTDTGGSGLHRGGNGVDVSYRFLEPGTIAIHDDRWLTYPWGVNGGEPGARGRKWIDRADGSREVLPEQMP